MRRLLLTLIVLLCIGQAQISAQLFVDPTPYSAEQMVMDFFDNSCVTPSNVTFKGADQAKAFFIGANTNLGVPAGILLCSGDVYTAPAPAGTFASTAFNTSGDDDLAWLIFGETTFDAAVLSFDLTVAQADTLSFRYVFASEEYPEYVGSEFNDVFGFFIKEDGGFNMNIAMIPGTFDPVAINTINQFSNFPNLYIDNEAAANPDIVYDGMTAALDAKFYAEPGKNYHVRIGVTDVADAVFDSGVFIGINSLCGTEMLVPPAIAEFQIQGNTIVIDNQSRYAQSFHWDFGDGTTSTERNPGEHEYAAPGEYTITLTTENYCCSDTFQETVMVGNPNNTVNPADEVFAIYPNPASDRIQLQLHREGLYDYTIVDISGREVLSGRGQGDEVLGLEGLRSGVYLIQLRFADEVYGQRMFVE